MSGCWESNPDYKTPSLVHYHNTTARDIEIKYTLKISPQ